LADGVISPDWHREFVVPVGRGDQGRRRAVGEVKMLLPQPKVDGLSWDLKSSCVVVYGR